jgi:hypothetical protein
MNRNLVGSIYRRSSIKIAHFVLIRLQTWPPQTILVSDWSISRKAFPLKPLGHMKWNFTESSIGASHQISVHLAKQFQRRRFLEIDQPETRIAYGSHV